MENSAQKMQPEKPKLVIIDSHALIHRAFHALPPMTNQKGEVLNAVYGYVSVFLKILKDMKPQYIVAAFDLPQPTFRHEEFEEYKAHRPKAPDDLISQFNKVKEVMRAFGVPIMEMPGYEADDVLGTICEKVKEQKLNVISVVLTGDLDTLQLVDDDKTIVYTLKKGITDTVIYDEKAVIDRYGLHPNQMVDFKGLKGDPSDNIPGVPGVGDKTAAALILKYGSIEGVYEEIEKRQKEVVEKKKGKKPAQREVLSEKLIEKMIEFKDQAFLSKKLSIIRRDAPIDFDIEKSRVGQYDKENILKMFKEMEFHSLVNRLPWMERGSQSSLVVSVEKSEAKEVAHEVEFVDGKEKMDELKNRINSNREIFILGVSSESEELSGLEISFDGKKVYLIKKESVSEFKEILESEEIKKISHNMKSLGRNLQREFKIVLRGISFDVMLASYLLNPGEREYSLSKAIFSANLAGEETKENESGSARHLLKLKEVLSKKIKDSGLDEIFYEIEMPLVSVLLAMEIKGIKTDVSYLENFSVELNDKLKKLEKEIYGLAGEEFNINSPQQISKILFDKLKIEVKGLRKTPGGVISTGASELEKLRGAHPITDLILEYRESFKLKSTYVDALPKMVASDGRIHTNYNQTGTSTGRLSSLEPNLQNIPIRTDLGASIRKAFVADDGYKLVSFDYSQIELRLASVIAKDEKMMAAFNEGKDIHIITASEIFNVPIDKVDDKMRRAAKTLNFGVLYGMSAKSFSETAKIEYADAKKFIKEYFNDFSGIANYIDSTVEQAKRLGYVQTLLGRRRYIPEILSSSWQVKQAAERMAANMPIQGTAADIIKKAMLDVSRELDLENRSDIRLLLQIHDELVFEIKEDAVEKEAKRITEIMEGVIKLDVPLEVGSEYGVSLGELKEVFS